jgi:hypothetical protein
VGSSCSARPQTASSSPRVTSAAGAAAKFLSLINNERGTRALGHLSRNAPLERIALAHAKRMAAAGKIYHNAALFYRSTLEALGNPSMVGENVGRGTNVDSLHKLFMESPEHRSNILEAGYGESGIAVVASGGQLWVVETFMSRVRGTSSAGSFGEDKSPLAKSHVLTFSGPALGAWRYVAPEPTFNVEEQVLGVSRTIPDRVPGGAAGVVVVMALAMVLGAALPRHRHDGEYV